MDIPQATSIKDVARNEIDLEISRLTLELRSRRNTLAPISSIPQEILTSIFAEIPKQRYGDGNSGDLLPVTQVCTEWRRTATMYPLLWTDLRLSPPGVAPHMLAWSRQLPIRVNINAESGDTRLFRDYVSFLTTFLPANLHRIQKLDIDELPSVIMQQVIPSLDQYAPLIDEVGLYFPDDDSIEPQSNVRLFGGSAPTLQSLTIVGANVLWESLSAPRLTRFHLDCRSIPTTMSQMLSALANMPCLEDLLVGGYRFPQCPAGYSGEVPVPALRVPLANLRKLTLHGPLDGCSFLVSHLDFPPLVVNMIICAPVNPISSPRLIHFMIPRMARPGSELAIDCSSEELTLNSVPGFIFESYTTDPLRYLRETLRLLQAVGFESVTRSISFHNNCRWIQGHWSDILSLVPCLQTLHFQFPIPVFISFVAAIMDIQHALLDPASEHVILPDLKRLEFIIDAPYRAGRFNDIYRFLLYRRDLGVPLSEVFMQKVDITAEEEVRFQDLVGSFDYSF